MMNRLLLLMLASNKTGGERVVACIVTCGDVPGQDAAKSGDARRPLKGLLLVESGVRALVVESLVAEALITSSDIFCSHALMVDLPLNPCLLE